MPSGHYSRWAIGGNKRPSRALSAARRLRLCRPAPILLGQSPGGSRQGPTPRGQSRPLRSLAQAVLACHRQAPLAHLPPRRGWPRAAMASAECLPDRARSSLRSIRRSLDLLSTRAVESRRCLRTAPFQSLAAPVPVAPSQRPLHPHARYSHLNTKHAPSPHHRLILTPHPRPSPSPSPTPSPSPSPSPSPCSWCASSWRSHWAGCSLTHARTHALTHARTHALTHSRTHLLRCGSSWRLRRAGCSPPRLSGKT